MIVALQLIFGTCVGCTTSIMIFEIDPSRVEIFTIKNHPIPKQRLKQLYLDLQGVSTLSVSAGFIIKTCLDAVSNTPMQVLSYWNCGARAQWFMSNGYISNYNLHREWFTNHQTVLSQMLCMLCHVQQRGSNVWNVWKNLASIVRQHYQIWYMLQRTRRSSICLTASLEQLILLYKGISCQTTSSAASSCRPKKTVKGNRESCIALVE